MTKSKSVASAGLLAALLAAPGMAHHSFAMFDQTKTVVLKGTVTEFQWTNPHSFIEIDAAGPGGKTEHWGIELNSPNNLTRQGWRRTSVKPGDVVTITINPLRNGMKGGLFNSVVLPDGHVLGGEHGTDGKPINVPTAN
ncbi:DUF6152 family protein [Sphingomonas sp. MMS24-J13]|uniref:DUF6152 family protein n=1 Tax=Sphingomonas sp. MMS24-J13 TaxID=3238686 RepID=UPI00384ECDF6